MERNDLNGKRIKKQDSTEVWLVINGRRRHIASLQVYINLFGDTTDGIISDIDLNNVDPGPPLNDGTCLVRSTSNGMIFLATGQRGTLRLMHILDFNSFLDFRFEMSKVIDVPAIIIDALPRGSSITSHNSKLSTNIFSTSSAEN